MNIGNHKVKTEAREYKYFFIYRICIGQKELWLHRSRFHLNSYVFTISFLLNLFAHYLAEPIRFPACPCFGHGTHHCIIKKCVQFPPNCHCSISQMLWAGITLSPCIIHFSSPHYRTCTYVTYTSLTLYMVYKIWRKACAVTFVYKSYWDWGAQTI